jgi:hypothetical protein
MSAVVVTELALAGKKGRFGRYVPRIKVLDDQHVQEKTFRDNGGSDMDAIHLNQSPS